MKWKKQQLMKNGKMVRIWGIGGLGSGKDRKHYTAVKAD
jgi:hypothetical protein